MNQINPLVFEIKALKILKIRHLAFIATSQPSILDNKKVEMGSSSINLSIFIFQKNFG